MLVMRVLKLGWGTCPWGYCFTKSSYMITLKVIAREFLVLSACNIAAFFWCVYTQHVGDWWIPTLLLYWVYWMIRGIVYLIK